MQFSHIHGREAKLSQNFVHTRHSLVPASFRQLSLQEKLITVNDKGSAVGRDKKGDESAALGIKIHVHTKATLIIIILNSASTVNRRRTKKRAAST